MNNYFKCIGIVGFSHHPNSLTTYKTLYHWLCSKNYEVLIEKRIAHELKLNNVISSSLDEIGQIADLAVVVGGDGNMLYAARTLAHYDIKVIGVNRGNLGFLTDLNPDNVQKKLTDIFRGNYFIEKRLLLEAKIYHNDCQTNVNTAINEVTLHSKKVASMINYTVYVDNVFAFSHHADGLIISTPTGSTAYSLSAGGPILIPSINAFTLIPMFPHTLSVRPLVINSNSVIRLYFSSSRNGIEISFDSQITLPIKEYENVLIRRYNHYLTLIHPNDYSYFHILNSKLGWSKKIF